MHTRVVSAGPVSGLGAGIARCPQLDACRRQNTPPNFSSSKQRPDPNQLLALTAHRPSFFMTHGDETKYKLGSPAPP